MEILVCDRGRGWGVKQSLQRAYTRMWVVNYTVSNEILAGCLLMPDMFEQYVMVTLIG